MSRERKDRISRHLEHLTASASGRSPGSEGHLAAQTYILTEMAEVGWEETGLGPPNHPFDVIDYAKPSPMRHVLGWLMASGFPISRPGPREQHGYPVHNLCGVFRANPTAPWRMLTAHYDHLPRLGGKTHPGALDNASAIAVAIETARELKRTKPSINYLFSFPDREEVSTMGLAIVGSRLLFDRLQAANWPLDRFLNVSLDSLGAKMVEGHAKDLFLLGPHSIGEHRGPLEKLCSPLRTFCAPVSLLEGKRFPLQMFPKDMLDRGDYAPFRDRGIPYLFLTSGTPWFYHSPFDSADRLSIELLDQTVSATVNLLQSPDLEQYLSVPVEDLSPIAPYSNQTLLEIAEFVDTFLAAKDFYPVSAGERRRLLRGVEAIRKHLQSGAQLESEEARRILFDLLLTLHLSGRRIGKRQ